MALTFNPGEVGQFTAEFFFLIIFIIFIIVSWGYVRGASKS